MYASAAEDCCYSWSTASYSSEDYSKNRCDKSSQHLIGTKKGLCSSQLRRASRFLVSTAIEELCCFSSQILFLQENCGREATLPRQILMHTVLLLHLHALLLLLWLQNRTLVHGLQVSPGQFQADHASMSNIAPTQTRSNRGRTESPNYLVDPVSDRKCCGRIDAAQHSFLSFA